ncbi:MAG: TIGR04282 family arsenosugar biosynthesis glycosyltransferase [Rubrivivax sp.]|nr:TIGR04282 family arsenosugar biosynthesis glycosyltransferase [Rubrivivax sp.]MDP3083838.1 TIGR04282 family arsenosugar biosynthesis glycosyltransferase [Rubrivivax sp.]
MNADCPVIVMAKAPVPGQVKTRLIPALGAAGAAALAHCLLARTLEQALAAQLGAVDLCCAPDAGHPAFAHLAGWDGLSLSAQGDGDLGQRMARALARALQRTERALLIGTDVPALDAAVLRRAAAALHEHDAVFVPALDGGYALVGLRRSLPALFAGIAWSTPRVMAQTRQRLAENGLRHAELDALADIDEPADLAQLPPGWRA